MAELTARPSATLLADVAALQTLLAIGQSAKRRALARHACGHSCRRPG
jgi:hypothetical protein